jgi:Fur family ferric uptake transcriptional regulator
MMEVQIAAALQQYQLRNTAARRAVLAHFAEHRHALSHGDVERGLPSFDRVTLYRTLASFEEVGLLHRVPSDSGSAHFALSHLAHQQLRPSETAPELPPRHAHGADEPHLHFSCTECGRTMCLTDVHVPAVQLPAGFLARDYNLVVSGVCAGCRKV